MTVLNKDMAPKPALCRLSMLLRPAALDVLISPIYAEAGGRLLYHTIPFPAATTTLAAFEECVYENPLLLADFGEVHLLLDADRYLLVPTDVVDDEICIDMLQAVWPDAADFAAAPLAGSDTALVMSPAEGVLPFVRRTWLDAEPLHPLHPLAAYYMRQKYTSFTICAALDTGGTGVVVIDGEKLLGANSTKMQSPSDIAYHLLATAKAYGKSHLDATYMLSGDVSLKDEVSALLRSMQCRVMAAPFPAAALAAGADSTVAPFALVATAY